MGQSFIPASGRTVVSGHVRHGHSTRELRDDGTCPAEDEVAALTGFVAVFGPEGDADAFLGVVRMMHGGVEPPGAVVVPDVVVGVEVDVCFHAPSRTGGVGHPLSQAKKFCRVRFRGDSRGVGEIPCLISGGLR